jgi:hypothetical protein
MVINKSNTAAGTPEALSPTTSFMNLDENDPIWVNYLNLL